MFVKCKDGGRFRRSHPSSHFGGRSSVSSLIAVSCASKLTVVFLNTCIRPANLASASCDGCNVPVGKMHVFLALNMCTHLFGTPV